MSRALHVALCPHYLHEITWVSPVPVSSRSLPLTALASRFRAARAFCVCWRDRHRHISLPGTGPAGGSKTRVNTAPVCVGVACTCTYFYERGNVVFCVNVHECLHCRVCVSMWSCRGAAVFLEIDTTCRFFETKEVCLNLSNRYAVDSVGSSCVHG